MAFALTLLYLAVSFLSPSVFPDVITMLHVNLILGFLVILALFPELGDAKLGSIPDSYLIFGVLFAASVSVVRNGFGRIPETLNIFLPILLTFYFVAIACQSMRRLKIVVGMLLAVAIFILFQGTLAQLSGDPLNPYRVGETVTGAMLYRWKGLGVLADPNDLAQFLVMLIPLLWLRWKPGNSAANFLFTLVPAAVLAVGIYFTHSRGGGVALLAILLFGFKDKLGVVLSSIIVALATVGLLALNVSGGRGMNDDDGGRIAAWVTGLETFKAHPIFGVGVGNFGDYNPMGGTAHNSFVLCLSEMGIFGYFFWMGTIVCAWTGLTAIIKSQTQAAAETKSNAYPATDAPAQRLVAVRQPWSRAPALSSPTLQTGSGSAFESGLYPAATPAGAASSWSPPLAAFARNAAKTEVTQNSEFVIAARVFRVSLVGLLTAGFFLSRTYSMTLYVSLGMAAALRLDYGRHFPNFHIGDVPIYRRIWIVIGCSVVFLYLFVRLRGPH